MSFGAVLLLGAKTKSALLLLQRQTDDRFQKRPATTLAAARISVTKTDRYESRIAAFRCCARTDADVSRRLGAVEKQPACQPNFLYFVALGLRRC